MIEDTQGTLSLTRKIGESIEFVLDGEVIATITVDSIRPTRVQLVTKASRAIRILRKELGPTQERNPSKVLKPFVREALERKLEHAE